ncbi:MAG: hypothetical protein IPJ65_29345 [Archangiaceae bacterium]|nr:hypothetical protein [Archangiaceae bacterium]
MSAAITAWALLAVMFTVMAMVRVALSAARSAHPEPRATPEARSSELSNVLLVRPVDAPTGGELANLRKVPSGLEQWVMSPDPTVPNHHPSDPRTQNRKLGHLKAAQVDPARTVLVVDADVEVDDALVDALLSALEGGADLAWAAPHPERRGLVRGLLVQSLHSFVVLDAVTFGARPVCGKAMALSPARARC